MASGPPALPAQSFVKRKSLRDQLDHFGDFDDEEIEEQRYNLLQELQEDVAQAPSYRWHAKSTQA